MEEPFTEGDFYAENFLPKDYLETYYNVNFDDDDDGGLKKILTLFLKGAHRAFTIDGIKGDTLIDIGTGPTIHQFLSACESFREIIATDYTDQNREEVQRWLKKEPGAFDWTPIVKYVCELEGDSASEGPSGLSPHQWSMSSLGLPFSSSLYWRDLYLSRVLRPVFLVLSGEFWELKAIHLNCAKVEEYCP
ncbi:nicotinamide N-methyltransferase-like [Pantherophis guttatus]|uniref:Nicotinamide N-methyltransferase-like n=1 Tax=Pantherophis guttatus TaxID=94885 RepID=A0A6P9CM85_PANGU|nr:nicotinamide N-methyltransferase-like [Pantherophis guttatus]